MARIADRYALGDRIGSGGMAVVHRAHDERLDRDVAVKLLRAERAAQPEFADRFRREARNAATIQHPNVARVYDFGEHDGEQYLVMELVEGVTLKEIVRSRGPLPEDEALAIAERVARGLQAAHARGVVHRDLKPQNVIVDAADEPRIVDFGIARMAGETQITRGAEILGTAHYLAPEQARGDRADARTDVYALGVVLYEMLTGEVPFDGATPVEIALKHLEVPPPSPDARRPGLRRATVSAVMRALAKDPARRHQTAAAFAAALAAARRRAVPVVRSPRARRGAAAAAALFAALALGGVALAQREDPRAASVAVPRPTAAAVPSAPARAPTGAPTSSPEPARAPVETAAAPAGLSTAQGAVAEFYERIARGDRAGAALTWSPRMRAAWPPQTYIDERFASTTGLHLMGNELVAADGGRATVAVDLIETSATGTTRWVGTWHAVRAADGGWLLDAPDLARR